MREEIRRPRAQYESDRQERADQAERDRAMIENLNREVTSSEDFTWGRTDPPEPPRTSMCRLRRQGR
eukprot:12247159-Prorocentrum_lima.AAC.1